MAPGRVPVMGARSDEHSCLFEGFRCTLRLGQPLEGLPVFLARTQSLEPGVRMTIARTAALAVTCIMLVALDSAGNAWVTNQPGKSVSALIGVAAPVLTPMQACLQKGENVCLP